MDDSLQARPFPVLIGDVGGTNARFAIVDSETATPRYLPVVQTTDFATIDEAIDHSILKQDGARPVSTLLAIAGVVEGDEIPLTNYPWVIRPHALISDRGFKDVTVLNDFEAQALAVVALGPDGMERIGGGTPEENASRVVLGPGTGLGVAGLVYSRGLWIPVPGEGGHMDLGPRSARDFEVFPHFEPIEGRVSGEQLLCGRGLVNLYRGVATASGVAPAYAKPSEVTGAGLSGSDPVAAESIDLFTTYLGRTAGDLALVFMARGGVFLTGGIAQKIVPALKSGAFRRAFEDKAPHSALMRTLPVYVVTEPLAALVGLAAYAQTPQSFGIEVRGRRWRV